MKSFPENDFTEELEFHLASFFSCRFLWNILLINRLLLSGCSARIRLLGMKLGDLETRLQQRRMKLHIHHTVLLSKPTLQTQMIFLVVFFNIQMNSVHVLHNSSLPQYVPMISLSTSINNISLASQLLGLKLERKYKDKSNLDLISLL